MGMIVGVAAAALALGMAGGLVALRQVRAGQSLTWPWSQPEQVITEPTAKAPPEVLQPRVDAVPPEGAARAPLAVPLTTRRLRVGDANACRERRAARARRECGAEGQTRRGRRANDAGAPPSNTAPDGGWVKPAWAVPDEEPRHAPDLLQDDAQPLP